jgi:RNA polymerase sigma-70 factor (ECF subfamily)
MDQASRSDDGAFAALAADVQDYLYRFALAHGLKHADAAEAVQEVLLRAYQQRRKWRPGGDVISYLSGVAMNVVREFRREHRRLTLAAVDLEGLAGPTEQDDALARRQARTEQLEAAIGSLPPRQREAFTCRYLLKMSIQDTAGAMDCSEGTVKSSCAAAWETIRRRMGVEHGND